MTEEQINVNYTILTAFADMKEECQQYEAALKKVRQILEGASTAYLKKDINGLQEAIDESLSIIDETVTRGENDDVD